MNLDLKIDMIENVTYDELSVGQSARLLRTLSLADIQAFAAVSGDTNPAHPRRNVGCPAAFSADP